MDHLLNHAKDFCDIKCVEDFIFATQLAQSIAIQHTLEAYRAAWPESTGICYYKLTDVYPACSWSTIDYYGVPKTSYYTIKNAFAPIHAALIIKSISAAESYPLYLFDDILETKGKNCLIETAFYNENLEIISSRQVAFIPDSKVNYLCDIKISEKTKNTSPLIISVKLFVDGILYDSHFYIQNYKENIGCLKNLPKTSLSLEVLSDSCIEIKNSGTYPAVGVNIENLPRDTEFICEDNMLFLSPGEVRKLKVNISNSVSLSGFNC